MENTENKDVITSLKDEDVEKVSGGAYEGKKITGLHPVATDYGGVKPHIFEKPVTVLGKYGMVKPIETGPKMAYGMKSPMGPEIGTKDKKSETEE